MSDFKFQPHHLQLLQHQVADLQQWKRWLQNVPALKGNTDVFRNIQLRVVVFALPKHDIRELSNLEGMKLKRQLLKMIDEIVYDMHFQIAEIKAQLALDQKE